MTVRKSGRGEPVFVWLHLKLCRRPSHMWMYLHHVILPDAERRAHLQVLKLTSTYNKNFIVNNEAQAAEENARHNLCGT